MDARPDLVDVEPVQGHLLCLSQRRSLAFHVRDGMSWVADFTDGVGELLEATVWFRDKCGSIAVTYPRRCLTLESSVPIPSSMFEQIEALHREVRSQHGLDEWNVDFSAPLAVAARSEGTMAGSRTGARTRAV